MNSGLNRINDAPSPDSIVTSEKTVGLDLTFRTLSSGAEDTSVVGEREEMGVALLSLSHSSFAGGGGGGSGEGGVDCGAESIPMLVRLLPATATATALKLKLS